MASINFKEKAILVLPKDWRVFKRNCKKRRISMSRVIRAWVRKDNETFKS